VQVELRRGRHIKLGKKGQGGPQFFFSKSELLDLFGLFKAKKKKEEAR
jgi:hypothetical protein